MTKELKIIEKQIIPIIETAKELIIKDHGSVQMAVEMLSKLNKINDKIIEEKEKITRPLNEALRAERARWKPTETINTEAINILRTKLSVYQTNLVQIQKEEELKIANRVKSGKGNLSLDTAVKKIEALPEISKEIPSTEGLVQFREVKVLKVTDIKLIPHEYFDLNETRLLVDLKLGQKVPGAEIEIKQVPANYR